MKTRKVTASLLCVVISVSIVSRVTFAQNNGTSSAPSEDIRIARLSGLAKVWGTVKYFHPYLAYREIDWDKALIEAIPKVNAAKSPAEFQEAINQMLGVLQRQKHSRRDWRPIQDRNYGPACQSRP